MNEFFPETKTILTALGVLADGSRIYNSDESWTGSNDEQRKPQVVGSKESAHHINGRLPLMS
jgi:hypothetical protein